MKIEFMTLQFTCDLSAGSVYSAKLLNEMAFSPNKELFRSNIKILLEYKWENLKNWIMFQNMILLSYIIFLIMNKIEVVSMRLYLLISTCIILIPETK